MVKIRTNTLVCSYFVVPTIIAIPYTLLLHLYEACYLVLQTNLGHTSDKTDLQSHISMHFLK